MAKATRKSLRLDDDDQEALLLRLLQRETLIVRRLQHLGTAASAQLNGSYRSGRLWAQLGWVAHFDACAARHEYELDSRGRPVQPTADELEQAMQLDIIADQLFARASEKGFEGGTDAAFGYLVESTHVDSEL